MATLPLARIRPTEDMRLEQAMHWADPWDPDRRFATDEAVCYRCGNRFGFIYSHWERQGDRFLRRAYLRKPTGWRWQGGVMRGRVPLAPRAQRTRRYDAQRTQQYGTWGQLELPCPIACPNHKDPAGLQLVDVTDVSLAADRWLERNAPWGGGLPHASGQRASGQRTSGQGARS